MFRYVEDGKETYRYKPQKQFKSKELKEIVIKRTFHLMKRLLRQKKKISCLKKKKETIYKKMEV